MRESIEKAVGFALTVAVAVEIGLGIAVGVLFGW